MRYINIFTATLALLFLGWCALRESRKRQLTFTILARISHIFMAIKIVAGIYMPIVGWNYAGTLSTGAHVVMELLVILVLTEALCYVYVLLPPLTVNIIRTFQLFVIILWCSLCGGRFLKGILYETAADNHWAAKVHFIHHSGIGYARQFGTRLPLSKRLCRLFGYPQNFIPTQPEPETKVGNYI
jgi:hypothetical protein